LAIVKQLKNSGLLLFGQLFIKGSSFIKQLILAFYLGISAQVDLLLISQIIPSILLSIFAGGAGEILVTTQKKNKSYNDTFLVLFISSIVLITSVFGLLYLLLNPLFAQFFAVQEGQIELFWQLSIIVVINQIPSVFVSGLQPLLYAKEKYKYYVASSLFSEIVGICFILSLFNSLGIVAFPLGILTTQSIKAIFYLFGHKLKFKFLFIKEAWREQRDELIEILKKTFSLSLQTLVNHLSVLGERLLSFRFLSPGVLSSINYSKTLSQLPKMAMLSSLLTTTYIEQVERKTKSQDDYLSYTNRMEKALNEVAFVFQMFSMIFAPIILVIFFKRGAFDIQAVEQTFLFYQILTIGFLPGLMTSFLSRTMYIESQYKTLFKIILIKTIIEFGIMYSCIAYSQYSIPIAIVLGKFFTSIAIFIYLKNYKPGILNVTTFIKTYGLLILLSSAILIVNHHSLNFILSKDLLSMGVMYLPFFLVFSILSFLYFKGQYKNDLLNIFKKRKKNNVE
jgi:putative peptidoglycan lipid II flippase